MYLLDLSILGILKRRKARKLLFSNPIYKSEIVFGSPMASFKWGDCKYTSSALSSGVTTVQADKISTPDYEPWLEDGGPVLLQTCVLSCSAWTNWA